MERICKGERGRKHDIPCKRFQGKKGIQQLVNHQKRQHRFLYTVSLVSGYEHVTGEKWCYLTSQLDIFRIVLPGICLNKASHNWHAIPCLCKNKPFTHRTQLHFFSIHHLSLQVIVSSTDSCSFLFGGVIPYAININSMQNGCLICSMTWKDFCEYPPASPQ